MAAPAGGDAGGNHNSSASMEAGELDQTFVESLRQKIQSNPITILREEAGSSSCCIHRVPPTLRQHDEKAYTPLAVSLGPFHHGNPMLQAMEEHKWRYLEKALSRATDEGLENFSRAIKDWAPRARECYSEIIYLGNDEFVQMMVLDGCFIVQFVLIVTEFLAADPNDPIVRQSWLWSRIIKDMLLLENQIPFFVLELVFDLIKSSMEIRDSLLSIFCRFFDRMGIWKRSPGETPRHLLHLVLLGGPQANRPINPTVEAIPSATRLSEAGVKLKISNANSIFDIIFEDGVLAIPPFYVRDSTYLLFLNYIAFEQCYTTFCGQCISTYIYFMNMLIDSADDVLILRRRGIIEHCLGSDEEAADLFNKLGRDVLPIDHFFFLSDVAKNINRYCSRPWHSWRANLIGKYFYSPWAIISLIGAIILLLFTALQTFFAVFSYVKPPS